MKKVFTLLILSVLTGVLGNRALAQNYQYVGSIDFKSNGVDENNGQNFGWGENNTLTSVQNYTTPYIDVNNANGYRRVSLHVDDTEFWRIGTSSEIGGAYLQMNNRNGWKSIYIDNLKQGDKIKLTTNPTKQCAIWTDNTSLGNQYRFTTTNDVPYVEFTVTGDGTNQSVQIQCIDQWAGIHSVELYVDPDYVVVEPKDPFFNYDPGYEVYDMFEVRDQLYKRDDNGNYTSDYPNGPIDNTSNTNYTVSDAGFELNGNSAQFFTFNGVDLTLNNRIAISQDDDNNNGATDRWKFQRGLMAPSEGSGYFSITNLKKGDRVQIFYTGDTPVFASNDNGDYNGCSAFYDRWNDGDFNSEDGDHYITPGVSPANQVEYIDSRNEGTIRRDEHISQSEATLYSSAVYVITEDGHMDLRLNSNNLTRIVKVYIWSDHQATMIDDYSERDYQYTSHFDITGELQAKEHIVPGGLEVRIGNEDKSQHAIVVASKEGPVSYVNAADGFKLPGVTGSVEEGIQINFNLGDNNIQNIPTTGTFYKFMPEVDGTMKVKFTPYSMYYYRYDINGNAIYYDNGRNNDGDSPWQEAFGRANEQTVNRLAPYYVKVSEDGGTTFTDAQDVVWSGASSGSSSGGVNEITLLTNPTQDDALLISDIQNLGGTDSNIITFYFENVSNNDIGYLVDSNWGSTHYSFNPNGSGTLQLTYTVQQIKNMAGNSGGVRANVYNANLREVTLTTSGSSSSSSGAHWLGNGGDGEFVLEVEAGKIYYLYGGWTTGAEASNTNYGNYFSGSFIRDINDKKLTPHACGVAELFDIAFTPAKQIYPLAKWVESGTKEDANLAYIVGYQESELTVKKMSGNITQCHPYIYETTENGKTIHKLGIKDIEFADGENPGGVVLIKFGTTKNGSTTYYKVDPVYVFTVAYDAAYHSDATKFDDDERGHTWDFSSSSLNGLQWDPSQGVPVRTIDSDGDGTNDTFENNYDNNSQNYAAAQTFGTYFNNFFANGETNPVTTSFLYEEMNYVDNGINRSDWLFNYREQKNGVKYDPRFLNKYDMEGDNADMVWDTEGIIIKASSNMSCIFNEFMGTDIHASEKDPDRYVGILSGGSFLIPHLNANDRVIVWMGSGINTDEMVPEDMRFHITNALDALHNPISESDVYLAGGSQWMGAKSDNNYRGCYHFFAKEDGDMEFTLEGSNSMCKLYKIQIYRGDRIITNEIKGATASDKFLLVSTAKDPNVAAGDNNKDVVGPTYNWTLKYFGKDQKLADTSNGVNNDIVAWTGAGISTKTLTTSAETDPTQPTYNTFTFAHDINTIGTFRARGKDMEKNMKYVADYGEHNVTVALQQTMEYPYTWDIMDMTGWSNNADRFDNDVAYGDYPYSQKPEWFDSVTDWDKSYEKSSRDLSLFGNAVGDASGYVLRLNTQKSAASYPQDNIFESAQTINNEPYYGNQLWADGRIVPESQGLWFHTPNQNTLNGSMRIYNDGMSVGGNPNWRYNMVVPNVPAGAAVYMRIRVAEDYCEHKYKFEGSDASSDLTLLPTDEDNEYIAAIKNSNSTKKHLTLSLVGYTLLKLAVSEDPKTVNIKGYASESHKRVIDHTLTSFFTGKPIYAYTAENYNESESKIDLVKITKPMPAATADGQTVGSVLYNSEAEQEGNTDARINILDGGFHLFVPDMHDYTGNPNDAENMKTAELQSTSNNMMKSYNAGGTSNTTIAQKGDDGVRYVLSYQYFEHDKDGQTLNTAQEEAFYRVAKGGAAIKPNSAYIAFSSTSLAKVSFLFEDELFGPSQGITTGITETPQQNVKAEWYSLDGRKLNGAPTEKGLYIINGKKVLVK